MPKIEIALDRVTASGVSGWAIDRKSDGPVKLMLEVDGFVVREVTANQYRSDLEKVREHGRLAFHIPLSAGFLTEVPPTANCKLVSEDRSAQVSIFLQGSASSHFDPINADGEMRTINKDGYFTVRFKDATSENRKRMVGFARKLMTDLESEARSSFLAYGTLLGCVREGDLIPHDDDFDFGVYLGKVDDLSAIESSAISLCRSLEAMGYSIIRFSRGQVTVTKGQMHTDLFLAWEQDGMFFMNFAINGEISPDIIFPLASKEMSGVSFSVPNQSEAVCELLYGASWRTPDPGFKWLRTGMNSVVDKDFRKTVYYWDRVYGSGVVNSPVPSQFAAFVAGELRTLDLTVDCLIDIGCGTARDTTFLSQFAGQTCGLDGSEVVIRQNRINCSRATFLRCNFNDKKECEDVVHSIRTLSPANAFDCLVIYTRFFLHAIDEEAEVNLLWLCAELSRSALYTLFFAEYRTLKDQDRSKETPGHYRRFIDHHEIIEAVSGKSFRIIYQVEGRGMAKYKLDDAVVGRLIADRARTPS